MFFRAPLRYTFRVAQDLKVDQLNKRLSVKVTKTCTKCGYNATDDSMDFCPKCGSRFKLQSAVQQTRLPLAGAAVMLSGFAIYASALLTETHVYTNDYVSRSPLITIYDFLAILAFFCLSAIAILSYVRKYFIVTASLVFAVLTLEYFAGINPAYDFPPTTFGFLVTIVGAIVVASARQEFS